MNQSKRRPRGVALNLLDRNQRYVLAYVRRFHRWEVRGVLQQDGEVVPTNPAQIHALSQQSGSSVPPSEDGPAASEARRPDLAGVTDEPVFCTECHREDALTAIERGEPLRREDWCDLCWATLSRALESLDHR